MSSHSTSRDRCINYLRVSDPTQSGNQAQQDNLRRLARANSLEVAAEIFDEGESGDDLARPGLAEVLAALERAQRQGQPVAWLLVDHSDRLSRADSIDTGEMLARMRRLGVRKIATPGRVYDLHKDIDRTLLMLECDHKNNPYLKELGRKTLDGMLKAAQAGFWTGQKPPFGYVVVRTPGEHGTSRDGRKKRRTSGRLAIDPEKGPLVRELFERYRNGESTHDLRRWLSARTGRKWSRDGVVKILRRETYTGVKAFGKRTSGRHAKLMDGQAVLAEDLKDGATGDVVRIKAYPAIVDQELFLAAGLMLDNSPNRGRKKSIPPKPLTGLCRCGLCGSSLTSAQQKGYSYFCCSRHRDDPAARACTVRGYMRGDEILRRVRATLAERLLAGNVVAELVALAGESEAEAKRAWEESLASARKALAGCDARLATARRRLASADDDMVEEYQRIIRELREERKVAEADLAKLQAEEPAAEEGDAALLTRWLEGCRKACDQGATADPVTLNALLKELVAEVRIHPPEKLRKGRQTVGKIEVVLPDWLSRVLATTASRGCRKTRGSG